MRARVGVAVAVAALGLGAASLPSAAGAATTDVLGVPCVPGRRDRVCSGTVATRVPRWDGVPLDVDVWLPPESTGPVPAHRRAPRLRADEGRGLRGPARRRSNGPARATPRSPTRRAARASRAACRSRARPRAATAAGHLADARYEGRDTQYLAGLLVDAGMAGRRIGVTGSSYGGGQSLMLATLRNRTMLPDGRLVPWTSPRGTPMEVAAAAPRIGWSDLTYALVPTGRTLDYRSFNPYGDGVGMVKESYLEALFAVGADRLVRAGGSRSGGGHHAAGRRPSARGEPYDAGARRRDHAPVHPLPLRLLPPGGPAGRRRVAPAPTVIYNAWTDDIMPAGEALRYRPRAQALYPGPRVGRGPRRRLRHNRGSLATLPTAARRAARQALRPLPDGRRGAETLDGVDRHDAGLRRRAGARAVPDASWATSTRASWGSAAGSPDASTRGEASRRTRSRPTRSRAAASARPSPRSATRCRHLRAAARAGRRASR